MSHAAGVPIEILRSPVGVVRPRDVADLYANASQELQRLAERGLLLRLAHGYYAVPPADWLGDGSWRPEIEAVAFGIAAVDQAVSGVAVAGISAARVLGLYPRALSAAVVATSVRRRPLATSVGRVHFWQRNLSALEAQTWRSELSQGRVTTIEQTLLDIASNPRRGGVSIAASQEALTGLSQAADWNRVHQLATRQSLGAPYRRARWFANALVPDAPVLSKPRHPVSPGGLKPISPTDPTKFGIRDD
jgi:predicted transcriptional regulator of viral defense system